MNLRIILDGTFGKVPGEWIPPRMDCYRDDRGLSRRTDPVKSGRFLMKVSIHSISNDKKV